jgi:hypothetical protein
LSASQDIRKEKRELGTNEKNNIKKKISKEYNCLFLIKMRGNLSGSSDCVDVKVYIILRISERENFENDSAISSDWI